MIVLERQATRKGRNYLSRILVAAAFTRIGSTDCFSGDTLRWTVTVVTHVHSFSPYKAFTPLLGTD